MKAVVKKSPIQQQGFTLIELVVVIVILGILAATAAPKFIDLSSDAKSAAAGGVEGALQSAATMANAKAIVGGQEDGEITVTGVSSAVEMSNGFPKVTPSSGKSGISALIDTTDDMTVAPSGTTLTITYEGCTITYEESASSGVRPAISSSC